MRILLDEHLDWRLARVFSDAHEVRSVRDMGWVGMRNGELLRRAEQDFDVLITMDRSMEHQQHLVQFKLTVVLLVSTSNRLEDTEGSVPDIERMLDSGVEPGRLYRVAG
jgi:predicted nuclease of predicted toxin-antitoxin system